MAALIIESKNPKNLKLLADLARQLGDTAKSISANDVEDLLLGAVMDREKTGMYVSKDEIMKKLVVK